MQSDDFISNYLNIPDLANEAFGEHETRNVTKQMDSIFEYRHPEPVAIDMELSLLPYRLQNLTGSSFSTVIYSDMSKAYDSCEYNDIKMVSRIVRLISTDANGYCGSTIYILSMMGDKQVTTSADNCPFGILSSNNGDLKIFKLESNPNKGEMQPTYMAKEPESEKIFMEQGSVDIDETRVVIASAEEKYHVLLEFEKALESLKSLPLITAGPEEVDLYLKGQAGQQQYQEPEWGNSPGFEHELDMQSNYEEGQDH